MLEQGGQAGKHGSQLGVDVQDVLLLCQGLGLLDVQGEGHLVIAFSLPVPGSQGAGLEIDLRFQVQAACQFVDIRHGLPPRASWGGRAGRGDTAPREGNRALRRPRRGQP